MLEHQRQQRKEANSFPLSERVEKVLAGVSKPYSPTKEELKVLGGLIDVTRLLEIDTESDIRVFLEEVHSLANRSSVIPAAVCIYPRFISTALEVFKDLPSIRVAAVAGNFPFGQGLMRSRISEVRSAVEEGAQEIDYLFPYTLFKEGKDEEVLEELKLVRESASNVVLKIILECSYLADAESIYRASLLALRAGADFLKTSTGFSTQGATPRDTAILSLAVKDFSQKEQSFCGIKPSGGISTPEVGLYYLRIAEHILGSPLGPERFRIGASRLYQRVINEMEE